MTKKEERELLYNKYGGKCAYCGEDLPEKGWHADHIEAIRRNKRKWKESGMQKPHLDILENKNPSCASCNINKHKMSIEEFRKQIEGFINSLNKRITQYKLAKRYGLVEETGIKVEFWFEKYEKLNN